MKHLTTLTAQFHQLFILILSGLRLIGLKILGLRLIGPILSGILIGTSYIPFPPWASFFCLIPLWKFTVEQSCPKKIFWGSWLCQFTFTLIGFNWIGHTMEQFSGLPTSVAYFILLIYCSLTNLFVPVACLLWFYLQKKLKLKQNLKLLLLALITALSFQLTPTIFIWNFGYPFLAQKWPMYHVAELIGFQGLSHYVILVNLLIYYSLFNRKSQLSFGRLNFVRFSVVSWVFVVSSFIGVNLWGLWLKQQLPPTDKQVKVMIVQGNIGNQEKIYAEQGVGFRQKIVDTFTDLTIKELHKSGQVDFAVWPETAFPDWLGREHKYSYYPNQLRNFLKNHKLTLLTGAYNRLPNGQTTNSLFALDEKGRIIDPTYYKTILVPFGEFIPFSDKFPILKKWLQKVADFKKGPGPSVIDIHGVKIGPQICYEGLFPEFTQGLSEKGAQIIVNVTNDSWYGTWQEPFQHYYMTLARAIEFRRPLVRSTNTGISTVILADGTILKQSPLEQEWHYTYEIPYHSQPKDTFFQHSIWLIPCLLMLFILGIIIFSLAKRPK